MKNLFLIFTLCLFSLSVLCGCGAQKTSQNALSHAKLMNKLTVGVKNDSKPFGFVDNEGNPAGFDVDVAKEIARQILGDENAVEFVYVTPSSRITDLNSRKVDMVIAAMSITPNRADVVSFSQPYYQSGQAIMVKEGSKISSLADLNGSNVGFVLGTTGEKTISPEKYKEGLNHVSIPAVLKAASLDNIVKPENCRLITPEEYDERYGEDRHGE